MLLDRLAQKLDRLYRDFKSHSNPLLHGHWQSYTPVWTAQTGTPAIGNGTLTGYYTRIGRTVICVVYLIPGDSTTFGTSGAYSFTLPVTASRTVEHYGSAYGYDSSPATWFSGTVRTTSTTTMGIRSDDGAWGVTTPVTWAASDVIAMQIAYEAEDTGN